LRAKAWRDPTKCRISCQLKLARFPRCDRRRTAV